MPAARLIHSDARPELLGQVPRRHDARSTASASTSSVLNRKAPVGPDDSRMAGFRRPAATQRDRVERSILSRSQTSALPMYVGVVLDMRRALHNAQAYVNRYCPIIFLRALPHDRTTCNTHCMTTATEWAVPEWTQGDRMRKALEAAGYGVAEAALRFGVGRNTVSNWIHDRTAPSAIVLEVWADWTNVPLIWIQTGIVPQPGDGASVTHRRNAPSTAFGRVVPFRPSSTSRAA
jgi:hypothetical protein